MSLESKTARWTQMSTEPFYFPEFLFYQRLFFGFLVLCFCHFAQIIGAVQAIQEKDAIQVIDLVLEDTSKPAFGANANRFTTRILAFYNHRGRTSDIIS